MYSSEGKWKYIHYIHNIYNIYISSRYISCQARTKFIGFILPIFRSFDSLLQDKILTLFCQNFIIDCYKNRLSQYKSFQRHYTLRHFVEVIFTNANESRKAVIRILVCPCRYGYYIHFHALFPVMNEKPIPIASLEQKQCSTKLAEETWK